MTRATAIAVLALVAGCARDVYDDRCGDDIVEPEGLGILLEAADPTQTYEIDVVADGIELELTAANGERDSVQIDLADGRTMRGFVDDYTPAEVPLGVEGTFLSIVVDPPNVAGGWGPAEAVVTVSLLSESVTAGFRPAYTGFDASEYCPGWWHAFATMTVPAP
jgi:hypothetical protein